MASLGSPRYGMILVNLADGAVAASGRDSPGDCRPSWPV